MPNYTQSYIEFTVVL